MSLRTPHPRSEDIAESFGWRNLYNPWCNPVNPMVESHPDIKLPLPPELPNLKENKKSKPRWDLLCYQALDLTAQVMAFGVDKHEDNGGERWRNVSIDEHFASLMRHLKADRTGEYIDPETGKPHLAHALCRVMFMLGIRCAQ